MQEPQFTHLNQAQKWVHKVSLLRDGKACTHTLAAPNPPLQFTDTHAGAYA
jgi:hypothetical protein